jgi:hypothetical protein
MAEQFVESVPVKHLGMQLLEPVSQLHNGCAVQLVLLTFIDWFQKHMNISLSQKLPSEFQTQPFCSPHMV